MKKRSEKRSKQLRDRVDMGILINSSTKVIVQGITGREGSFHTEQMAAYGTQIVAGVSPQKGGSWVLDGKIPVFDTMQAAMEVTEANASIIFVPARNATDALFEAADSGVELVVCITEGVPVQDVVKVCQYMSNRGVRLVGPNCSGIINPGEAKLGVAPSDCVIPGKVGVISRSGTLSYLVMSEMKSRGIGVSTCIGIGGDIVQGTTFVEALELFETDPYTERILLIGEVGGLEEERAASYVAYKMTKPVTALLVGKTAPQGKKMGHSGAFIEAGIGGIDSKIEAFESVGVRVVTDIKEVPDALQG
ncbi:MAG TPA: succinate--CoA ligase subunit alpha [Flexilinea sp.]|jgi:succinyl-CoA synthetase alpha subunit|nr:succinate--CoA ligase subunit alpha [Flexilinea sp.]HQF80136.1 succinate--CoA ligase subunit alpha [Flexilinea sp.]